MWRNIDKIIPTIKKCFHANQPDISFPGKNMHFLFM